MNATLRIADPRVRDYRCIYDGQTDYQPAYVYLDLETGEAGIACSHEIGGAVTADIYEGRTQTWPVSPHLPRDRARALMRRLRKPLADALAQGEIEYDEGRWRGYIPEACDDKIDEIVAQA